MLSNVELINAAGMKCNDMAKASVARCFHRDFELMFADAWKFNYSGADSSVIGGNISVGENRFAENLSKFHGVETLTKDISGQQECLDFLLSHLDQEMPINMGFDQAYLPWAKEVRKKVPLRYTGNILLWRYDQDTLKCIDIHGSQQNESLPFSNFLEYAGTVDKIKTNAFRKKHSTDEFDLKEHIELTENYLFKTDGMFEQMAQYAGKIKETLNFQQEIDYTIKQGRNLATPNWIIMVADIIDVGRMRALYSLSLKYMADTYKNADLDNLSNEFKMLWSKWQLIVSVLVKSYYAKNYDNLNLRVSNSMLDIIEEEKKLADKLAASITSSGYANKISHMIPDDETNIQYQYPDIRHFFNNKAFSTGLSGEKADFDGLGNYYLLKDVKGSEVVLGRKITFRIQMGENDNIKCLGQSLKVDLCGVRQICFLGACESGAFFGEFELSFQEEHSQKAILGFGEWRFGKCELGESLAYVADRVYFNRVSEQEKGYIFFNTINVPNENVSEIKLPNCENMHIFAITVCSL